MASRAPVDDNCLIGPSSPNTSGKIQETMENHYFNGYMAISIAMLNYQRVPSERV